MADPLISLDTERASVQPGGQARVTITVSNPGTVVEGYRLQVLGPTAGWAEVVPPEVSVYPQQEASAAVVFSPPAGANAPSGTHPFGVIARSTLDPAVSAVAEGDVDLGQVYGMQAKIIPVTSAGRWRGRHVIQLSNWGNAPVALRMAASDPDDALGFYLSPEVVNLPPGGRASVRLSARTKHPFLRGTTVRLPFQVVGERLDAAGAAPPAPGMGYGDPSRPVVDAALNQKPILSKTFITVVTALLVAVVALLAYLHFKPPTGAETLASRGSPPKPTLTVVSVGPDNVSLAWTPVDLAEGYKLQQIDPQTGNPKGLTPVDGSLAQTTVTGLPSQTNVCFRLAVTRSGLTGPFSDQVCTKTTPPPATASPSPTPSPSPSPSPSASPSASPTPSFTPGDPNTDPVMKQHWIAAAYVLDKTTNLEAAAKADVQTLVANGGLPGKYLDSQFYPRLKFGDPASTPPTPLPSASWVVFVGPFNSPADAAAQCTRITDATGEAFCQVGQPDPP